MDAVDTFLSTYPASPVVLDVLGTLDADEIRAQVRSLEPATDEIFAFGCSVGATFGLRLRDGSRVALKLHTLYRDPDYFRDVQRVQSALADAGFPAPRPLRSNGRVTVEEWRDDGVFRDAHESPVREALASVLVRLIELASASDVRPRRAALRAGGVVAEAAQRALRFRRDDRRR